METPNASQHQELERNEVLRFIVTEERLTKTLRHFGVSKDKLFDLFLSEEVASSNPDVPQEDASPKAKSSKGRSKSTASKSSTTKAKKKAASTLSSKESSIKNDADSKKTQKTLSKKKKVEPKASKSSGTSKTSVSAAKSKSTGSTTTAKKSTKKSTKVDKKADKIEAVVKTKKTKSSTSKVTKVAKEASATDKGSTKSKESGSSKSKASKEGDKKPRKTSKRQSSPRGRRAANFEPENYIYQRLLIYTDGAARGNPGESGAGVVLKTPEGEEVGRFGRYLGKHTNNYAEYQALLLGLHHAREFGARDITILSDSELLVRQLLGEYRVRATHLRELFDQAKDVLTLFDKYQVKRIGREKNSEADSMANRAIDEKL